MIKKKFKNIIVWLTILLISLALIISNFGMNSLQNYKNNSIQIDKYNIKITDIENITKKILYNKKNTYNIKNIESKIQTLIKKNIIFNIKIIQLGIITSKKELLNTILSIDTFKINNKFSINLYNEYLKQKKTTEVHFQNYIKKNSIQNQLKYIIKFTKKKHTNVNIKYKNYKIKSKNDIKKNIKKNIKDKILNEYINNNYDIKYIDLSIPNIIKNIKINIKNIENYYSKKKNKYEKQNIIKIDHTFINKNKLKVKKKIWLTNNEIYNKTNKLFNNYTKPNNLITIKTNNGLHTLKLIKKNNIKIYNIKEISNDLINKYKKQKSYNYIKNNKINIKNNSLKNIAKKFNLNINKSKKNGLTLLKNIKTCISLNNEKKIYPIQIKKTRHIILKKIKIKDNQNQINFKNIFKFYINKNTHEKIILKTFLKEKKSKIKNIKWNNINTNKKIFNKRILKKLQHKKHKNIILKYKNTYYIIKSYNIKINKKINKKYLLIKNFISKK